MSRVEKCQMFIQPGLKLLTFGCHECCNEQKLIAQYWVHAFMVTEDASSVIIPETIRCPYCRRTVVFNLPSVNQK